MDVAKDAAEMILLEHDLCVLYEGVSEGRRTFGNVMKYIMMGTSSNFGNMFSKKHWIPVFTGMTSKGAMELLTTY